MVPYEDNLRRPSDNESHCPACGRRHPLGQEGLGAETVAKDDPAERDLVTIARFANAAEAGYFAQELSDGHGLTVHVRIAENFDALSGFWQTRFVLVTPRSSAPEATSLLKEIIAATDGEEDELYAQATASPGEWTGQQYAADEQYAATISPTESTVNWVPILLTLAAGSAVFFAAKKGQQAPVERVRAQGQQRIDFWDQLAAESTPWVQYTERGPGVRELRILPDGESVTIREDLDGDGEFEREIRFER